MPSDLAPFLVGYCGGALAMLLFAHFLITPRYARLGYLAGYCDAHLDIRDEIEELPSPEEERPWGDERWYPSVRRRVLEMHLEETGDRDG